MRNLLTTTGILFLCFNTAFIQTALGQNEQVNTQRDITANFRSAQSLYKSGDYEKALERIEKVEALFDREDESTTDLKIKILLGLKRYAQAEKELDKMERQRPSRLDRFRQDMASYREQINAGLGKGKTETVKAGDLEATITVIPDDDEYEDVEVEFGPDSDEGEAIEYEEESSINNLEPIRLRGTVNSSTDYFDENGESTIGVAAAYNRTRNVVPGKEITTVRRTDKGANWGEVVSVDVDQKDGKGKTGLTVETAEDGTLSGAYYRDGKVIDRFEKVQSHAINTVMTQEGQQTNDQSKAAFFMFMDFYTPILSDDQKGTDLRKLAYYTVVSVRDFRFNLLHYRLFKRNGDILEEFAN